MKLKASIYIHPKLDRGTYTDVFIEDVSLIHKRQQKYIAIGFEMYYFVDGDKVVLGTKEMGFIGMEGDDNSTNRTTTFSIANPDYDAEIEGSQEKLVLPLFDYITEYGEMPVDYTIVDYGYPTYEKVMMYFEGGTLENPEINITDPLAVGFLLNNLDINNEMVGKLFIML